MSQTKGSDPASSMLVGARLGVYLVGERIGAGGMGEVYRARDTKLGRDVAIKILPQAFTADPDRLARFEREARVLASLNHPNICAIYGFEESDLAGPAEAGHYVRGLVLELVDGETLAERIGRGSVPVPEVMTIAAQVADALDAAHEKGIVHRDLKPANIKITPEGIVKVLDFGLAKRGTVEVNGAGLASDALTIAAGGTHEGTILGTVAYMSPEQARGHAVDRRTDIWAFGCVLYEMLTRRTAFKGETVSDTIVAILERDPDWRALPAATSTSLHRLLRRCLDKDQRHRLRDIGDARSDLIEALDVFPSSPNTAPDIVRRRSWAGLGVAGVVTLASAVALGLWSRQSAETPRENPLANATFTRYTNFEGSELDAAISPDGRFIVFLSNRGGLYDAWVSQVGSGEFLNVSNNRVTALLNDEIRNVGFSPDGRIWLRRDRTDSMGVKVANGTLVLPVIGGELKPLLDRGINPVWSPDGNQLLYHEPAPGDPIFIADLNGRNPRKIFAAQPGTHCHYLIWSRDGRFVYFVSGIPPDEMDIWRILSSGGAAERLTSHNGSVAYPTFVDDRTLLYRATAADGSGPWLYALDVQTREARRVSVGAEQYLSIAAAADGRRLVATVSNPSSGLWSVPLADGIVDEKSAQRVPAPTVTAMSPRFGPDYLLYLSSKEGVRGLWRFRDGSASELWRSADGGLLTPPAVSSGGRQFAFTARVTGRGRLFLMDEDGTNVRPLAATLDVRDSPSWSPDGKWVVAASVDGLVKVPTDGGVVVSLAQGLFRLPTWSPDGRFILYAEALQGAGYTVKAMSPDGKPYPIPPLWVRRGGDRYRLLPDSRQVVYIAGDYGRQDFWLLDLQSGDRRQLTNLQPGFSIKGFDVSPDGRQILFDRVRENADVVLINLPASDRQVPVPNR